MARHQLVDVARPPPYFAALAAASALAMPATWRPWKRAIFSSFSLGWRAPSVPASVEAP
jgi:hypothetical protein